MPEKIRASPEEFASRPTLIHEELGTLIRRGETKPVKTHDTGQLNESSPDSLCAHSVVTLAACSEAGGKRKRGKENCSSAFPRRGPAALTCGRGNV